MGIGVNGCQDAGGLAACRGTLEDPRDGRLHVGVSGIAAMSEPGGKIRRSDEEPVHTGHGGNLVHRADCRGAFDLHDDRDVVVGAVQVTLHRTVVARAMHHRHAARAFRRIARRGYRAARFVGRLHEGKEEVVEADVEQPLHDHAVVPVRAHHGGRRAVFERHQLRDERERVVGCVFAVEQDPVEAGQPQHLGRDRAAQLAPAPDEPLSCHHILAKRVREGRVRSGAGHVRDVLSWRGSPSHRGYQAPATGRSDFFSSTRWISPTISNIDSSASAALMPTKVSAPAKLPVHCRM